MTQPVLLDRRQQRILVLVGETGERVGQSRPDDAAAEEILAATAQPVGDGQSPRHPLWFAPQDPRRSEWSEPVVGDQRGDDASLIKRGDGAWRSIAEQHAALELRWRSGRLDDHRDLGHPRLAPAVEAFEPVNDLVPPIGSGHDAQGQRGQLRARRPRHTGPQGAEGLAEQIERNVAKVSFFERQGGGGGLAECLRDSRRGAGRVGHGSLRAGAVGGVVRRAESRWPTGGMRRPAGVPRRPTRRGRREPRAVGRRGRRG
jgi:hypothetical protein